MTNPQPNLLELAKQGNPRAIAVLMNRPLQPRGITADVMVQGNLLEVTLEAEQTPNQNALAQFVHKGLSNLNITSINRVRLSGKRRGHVEADWTQEFELQALPDFLEAPTPVPDSLNSVAPPLTPLYPAGTEVNETTQLQPELDVEGEPASTTLQYGTTELVEPNTTVESEATELEAAIAAAEIEAAETETVETAESETEAEEESTSERASLSLSQKIVALVIAGLLGLGIAYYIHNQFFASPQTASNPEAVPPPPTSPEASPTVAPETNPEASPEASPTVAETPVSPASPTPEIVPAPVESPASPVAASPSPEVAPNAIVPGDPFRDAVNKATQASSLTQSAATPEQWQAIAKLWQDAATLMASVSPQNTNYQIAQERVPQYLSNRDYAVQRSQAPGQ
jgi:hypothetical protein